MKNLLSGLAIVILIQGCGQPSNWNQYLGPDRNAIHSGTKILRSWGDAGPKELWSLPLGEGFGGASIFDDEVFILDRVKGESDLLRCIDFNSGKEKWNFTYDAKGELSYPGSRAVPTVDKKHVWSVGPQGHFYCIDRKTQKPVWNHHLVEDFNTEPSPWGISQSPLIYKDLVIVAPHGDKAGVVALHKTSGEIAWKSRPLNGFNFHASPTLANYGGINQVIMISPYNKKDSTETNEVVAFNADSGEELWTYHGLRSFATITPALVIDEKRLFLTDGSYNDNYNPVSIMLEITRVGDKFQVNELFLTEEAGSKMHTAVQFEDHLYLNHSGNPRQMQCLTMEGKVLWEEKSAPDFELGALIMVDGLILNQNGKNGDIHLIQPDPAGYMELGKASFFSSEKSQAWSPLAFSQGKLIIRDQKKMVCLDLQNLAE